MNPDACREEKLELSWRLHDIVYVNDSVYYPRRVGTQARAIYVLPEDPTFSHFSIMPGFIATKFPPHILSP